MLVIGLRSAVSQDSQPYSNAGMTAASNARLSHEERNVIILFKRIWIYEHVEFLLLRVPGQRMLQSHQQWKVIPDRQIYHITPQLNHPHGGALSPHHFHLLQKLVFVWFTFMLYSLQYCFRIIFCLVVASNSTSSIRARTWSQDMKTSTSALSFNILIRSLTKTMKKKKTSMRWVTPGAHRGSLPRLGYCFHNILDHSVHGHQRTYHHCAET